MTIQTTYTQARDGLAKLMDQAAHNHEVVSIQHYGEEDVALIALLSCKVCWSLPVLQITLSACYEGINSKATGLFECFNEIHV